VIYVKLEREILITLGLSLYEVKALTEVTINEPANDKFKKLIQGDEYTMIKFG
jgi:hypothetical protein